MDDFFYLAHELCKKLVAIGYNPTTRFVRDTKNKNNILFRTLLPKGNKDRYVSAFTLGELKMNSKYHVINKHGEWYLIESNAYACIEVSSNVIKNSELESCYILKGVSEIEVRAKAILYHHIQEQIDLYKGMDIDLCYATTGKMPNVIIHYYIYQLFELGAYFSQIPYLSSVRSWWNKYKIADFADISGYCLVEYESEELGRINTLLCDSYDAHNSEKYFATPYGYKIDFEKAIRFTVIPSTEYLKTINKNAE